MCRNCDFSLEDTVVLFFFSPRWDWISINVTEWHQLESKNIKKRWKLDFIKVKWRLLSLIFLPWGVSLPLVLWSDVPFLLLLKIVLPSLLPRWCCFSTLPYRFTDFSYFTFVTYCVPLCTCDIVVPCFTELKLTKNLPKFSFFELKSYLEKKVKIKVKWWFVVLLWKRSCFLSCPPTDEPIPLSSLHSLISSSFSRYWLSWPFEWHYFWMIS